MLHEFSRSELVLGPEAMERLGRARVAVFGIGGVGGAAAEALARCAVGRLTLVDRDVVSITNINRQVVALHSTIGRPKTEVMRERILDINPRAEVEAKTVFYTADNADEFDLSGYDYIVDAIDTVTSKLLLAERARRAGVPLLSSMGTGNKRDPFMLQIGDISKTSVCPLARVMRKELRARGISHLKVLFSPEEPVKPAESPEKEGSGRRQIPGSLSFVPPVAGMMIAAEVVRDLTNPKKEADRA